MRPSAPPVTSQPSLPDTVPGPSITAPPTDIRTVDADGLLFIGDPHLGTLRPDRRRDDDYLGVLIGKMEQAEALASRHRLQPVCLGDLFHSNAEVSGSRANTLFSRLGPILARATRPWWVLTGNHDKAERLSLQPGDALHAIAAMGLAVVLDQPGWWGRTRSARGTTALIGGTPYGHPLPADVDGAADPVVWVTHHDLAFGGAHPGAHPIPAIAGVLLAVNGHLHPTYRPVRRGPTTWWNPGNTTRLSVDQADHLPRVWSWRPSDALTADGTVLLTPHPLDARPGPDVFDLTGRDVRALNRPEVPATLSRFVVDLAADDAAPLEGRGAYLAEAIAAAETEGTLTPAVAEYLRDLLRRRQATV